MQQQGSGLRTASLYQASRRAESRCRKKWLSYRERDLLRRDVMPEEVEEVSAMARRIAAIILLGPALDANYQLVTNLTYQWPA
jgi:hypothetical protein